MSKRSLNQHSVKEETSPGPDGCPAFTEQHSVKEGRSPGADGCPTFTEPDSVKREAHQVRMDVQR